MNLLQLFLNAPTAVIISVVVSFVIPALSATVAKVHWPDWVVGLLSLFLAAANGFFTEWAKSPDDFAWKGALGLALVSYLIAVLAHYGIVKGDLYDLLKNIGGKPDPAADDAEYNFAGADPLDTPAAITPADPDQPAAGVPPAPSAAQQTGA